jgi:hypothetical protein
MTKNYKINYDEISIEVEDNCYNISVDDESETYKTLVMIGKAMNSSFSDDEAFEEALKHVINNFQNPNENN